MTVLVRVVDLVLVRVLVLVLVLVPVLPVLLPILLLQHLPLPQLSPSSQCRPGRGCLEGRRGSWIRAPRKPGRTEAQTAGNCGSHGAAECIVDDRVYLGAQHRHG